MARRPLSHPRIPSQPAAFLPMKERKTREDASRPRSALGCWRRPRQPPPSLTSTLCLLGRAPGGCSGIAGSCRWVLRDCRQLPVTAKAAAASSGQLANNSSVAACPASHGKCRRGLTSSVPRQTPVWPHVWHPTANTSVVSRAMRAPVWPHIQHPVASISAASHPASHGERQAWPHA